MREHSSGSRSRTFPRRTCGPCSRVEPRAPSGSSGAWFRAACSSTPAPAACTRACAPLPNRERALARRMHPNPTSRDSEEFMLPKVSAQRFSSAHLTSIEGYRHLVDAALFDELQALARELKGVRICHVNSTGFGGGVAELLARNVPFANALGLCTDWRLVQGTPEFFSVTKALHNALQGASYALTEADKAIYLHVNRESAKLLHAEYDV